MDSHHGTTSEQLVRAALAGDAQAFGELVERHERALYRFLLCRTRS